MIAVVDYGRGNLFSLGQALQHLGAAFEVTSDPDVLARANRIILPGVSAFGDAMQALRARGLVEPLRARARAGVPLLGICLGMQMLVSRSTEFGDHEGLNLIPGVVSRLPSQDGTVRIPNVGWRRLVACGSFLSDLPPDTAAYFVHSYAPILRNQAAVEATFSFGQVDVAAVIRQGLVIGYQFHPEKSGEAGLALIRRFLLL